MATLYTEALRPNPNPLTPLTLKSWEGVLKTSQRPGGYPHDICCHTPTSPGEKCLDSPALSPGQGKGKRLAIGITFVFIH